MVSSTCALTRQYLHGHACLNTGQDLVNSVMAISKNVSMDEQVCMHTKQQRNDTSGQYDPKEVYLRHQLVILPGLWNHHHHGLRQISA